MSVRRLSLEEWFLAYQLRQLSKSHAFYPASLDVDVTALVKAYQARGQRFPTVPVLIKAMALTACEVPEVNRAYFRTPFGDRLYEPSHRTVNLPVTLREGGREHLSATAIREADQKGIEEIRALIRQAKGRTLAETWLTGRLARGRNHLFNRLALRLLHFFVYRFPWVWASRGGGALSVSALVNEGEDQVRFRAAPFGPTAVTVFTSGVEARGEHSVLPLGVGFDHCALTGVQLQRILNALTGILSRPHPGLVPEVVSERGEVRS